MKNLWREFNKKDKAAYISMIILSIIIIFLFIDIGLKAFNIDLFKPKMMDTTANVVPKAEEQPQDKVEDQEIEQKPTEEKPSEDKPNTETPIPDQDCNEEN